MKLTLSAIALALLASACTSSPAPDEEIVTPDPFPIAVPEGKQCTDVIGPPEVDDTRHVGSAAQLLSNTVPPTSGTHFDVWFNGGEEYDEPIPDGNQVHNLEHGHVVVQYRDVTDAELDAIAAPLRADPPMTLLAPRPSMPYKLALTAWTRIQVCDEIPDDVSQLVADFVAQNRDSGLAPESLP